MEVVRSIEQAIDIFSDEVELDLETGPRNDFEAIAREYGEEWLDTVLPRGLSAKKLYLDGEYYGGMVYQRGWNGVMKACTYNGRHPDVDWQPRKTFTLQFQRSGMRGLNYLRGDNNDSIFLGVAPITDSTMDPITENWLLLVRKLRETAGIS